MIVEPKVRGFICTTAHPIGCASRVKQQIDFVNAQKKLPCKAKNVLVLGSSTGYGLASRIVASFGLAANTIGVFYERPADDKRTASAGWYNSVAFEKAAADAGIYAKSFNGDAFSQEMKNKVIECIKSDLPGGKVDMVIYSLAAPRRQDHAGIVYNSVLKPIGEPYSDKTVNLLSGEVSVVSIDPATTEEIVSTEKVMGGEDWALWIEDLLRANVLSENAYTLAYSYIGPKMTYPIYREGTIGVAKEHLEITARDLDRVLNQEIKGRALVAVNKALVTQASSAIPVVPLYISLLYQVMKEQSVQEDCIEQIYRLFAEHLCADDLKLDDEQRIRIDDRELDEKVQNEVTKLWSQVSTANLEEISDIEGCRREFYQLFGFEVPGVDYTADVNVDLTMPSIDKE